MQTYTPIEDVPRGSVRKPEQSDKNREPAPKAWSRLGNVSDDSRSTCRQTHG
jgi:hypothetical protein